MIFGRHNVKEVEEKDLGAYNKSLFDAKVRKTTERAAARLGLVIRALDEFERACIAFGDLDAEPDIEFIAPATPSSAKEQKARYARAVTNEIASARGKIAIGAKPEYQMLLHCESMAKGLIESILKLNASFKIVILGYGDYLYEIKRAFKSLEDLTNELGSLLDLESATFGGFTRLSEEIEKLEAIEGEIVKMKNEREALEKMNIELTLSKKSGGGARKGLSLLNKELEDKEAKRRALSNTMEALLKPLERVARKHDHESNGKFRLVDVIERPFEAINEQTYPKIIKSLNELVEKVHEYELEQKSAEMAESAIKRVLSTDLLQIANNYSTIVKEEASTREQINILKMEESSEQSAEAAKREMNQRIEFYRSREEELGKAVDALKASITNLFFEYYKEEIKIR
ncbi:MAG: hypothetical protein ACP5SA_02645 [Candidatus Micrarchaeia archaeon]